MRAPDTPIVVRHALSYVCERSPILLVEVSLAITFQRSLWNEIVMILHSHIHTEWTDWVTTPIVFDRSARGTGSPLMLRSQTRLWSKYYLDGNS